MDRLHRNGHKTFSGSFRLLILTLALVVLSMAIVNWGLQYKMSLYHNGPVKASVAKLWSGSKDGAQVSNALVAAPEQAPAFGVFEFLLLFGVLFAPVRDYRTFVTFLRWRWIIATWKRSLVLFEAAYFFRPPPALA